MNDESEAILPLPFWIVLLIIAFCWPSIVFSKPMFAVTDSNITVTLYDDKCSLDVVKNLPYKAVWTENGQNFEGCWGPWVNDQRVVAYFEDKTVALIPFSVLSKVQGA